MTQTPSTSNCPDCGEPLPANSPQALCPACLMRQALASRTLVEDEGKKSATPPPSPEEIADKFPQFEILECLGRGGMGVVYKARQKSLNRLVAIKILAPERKQEPHFAERFAREAELLAKLNHPHIVTIHDFGVAGSQLSTTDSQPLYYLVMEFVDGVNLRDLLRDGKLEAKQALAIVPPICEALQYAHDKGIVHRDIKPENLLLDRDGRIKIADFGIAVLIGTGGENIGTPPYMAPEQSGDSVEVDSRADIYALGVVLYEMLTGERPGKDLVAPSKKAQIDVRLDEMVLRALEKEPELRYQTAGEFRTVAEMMNNAPVVDASPTQLLKSSESLYATPEFLSTVWGAMKLHQGMGALLLFSDRLEFQTGLVRTVIPLGSVRRLDLITYPFFQSPAGLRSIEVEFEDAGTSRRLVLTPSKGQFSFAGTTNNRVFEWFGAIREAIQNKTGSPPAGASSPVPYQGFSADGRLVSAFTMLASVLVLFGILTALAVTGSWKNMLPAAVPFIFGVSFVLALAWRQRSQWQKEHPMPECLDSREGQTALGSKSDCKLSSTLALHALVFAVIFGFMYFIVPPWAKLMQEFERPLPTIPSIIYRISDIPRIWVILALLVLYLIDVSGCFLARRFGGPKALRVWSVVVIVFLLMMVVLIALAISKPLLHLTSDLGQENQLRPTVSELDQNANPSNQRMSWILEKNPPLAAARPGLELAPTFPLQADAVGWAEFDGQFNPVMYLALPFPRGGSEGPVDGLRRTPGEPIHLNIYRGTNALATANRFLGSYEITCQPPDAVLRAEFSLSSEGILHLNVYPDGNGVLIAGRQVRPPDPLDKPSGNIRKMVLSPEQPAETEQDHRNEKITVEDLALQMIVAIREKNDAKLKSLASDQVKGWPDALPVFAVELREHFRQFTGNENFDLKAEESLVEGDLAAVRCTGPVELEGKCLVLFFVKTKEGWRNHSLRNSTVSNPLEKHLADLKVTIPKQE